MVFFLFGVSSQDEQSLLCSLLSGLVSGLWSVLSGLWSLLSKTNFLEPILSTSKAKARKWLNQTSKNPFCRLLEPMPRFFLIGPPGAHLSTSGAIARRCSNRTSRFPSSRLLKPMPENVQIGSLGTHFVDFCSQCRKMLKSNHLEPILSTSGATKKIQPIFV